MELQKILEELCGVIEDRKINPIEGSYTSYLFKEGIDKILKKVGEESSEVIIASKNNNKEEEVYEICDLIYHLLVLMSNQKVNLEDITEELEKRRQKICNKKTSRKIMEGIH
ncbi:phosphoribosyl-ATP diphosphatase [Clostridium sp. JNZ X4-2]